MTNREKLEQMQVWTSALFNTVNDQVPDIIKILDGEKSPIEGATKEQAAELTWRQIDGKLSEVIAAAKEIRNSCFRSK